MISSRSNAFALAILLAVAFALRAWHPERMAIEHFDEGVYASNFFSGHLDFRYPDQHLYAPPFFPALLEWALILTGGNPHAVMWVNVVLGTALVWAVWWTTRDLALGMRPDTHRVQAVQSSEVDSGFRIQDSGRRSPAIASPGAASILNPQHSTHLPDAAALAAAALVAFSDLLIQYSRAALTDVPVCLWMTLAVGAGARALRTGSFFWIGASAALTALAWWTKYSGWLPLAILGAGAGGWAVFQSVAARGVDTQPGPHLEMTTGRVLFRWGLIALGAVILWIPFLWDLQQYGGYAAVAKNHAGYLVGWSGWWDSLLRHLAVDRHDRSLAAALGMMVSLILGVSCFTWNFESVRGIRSWPDGEARWLSLLFAPALTLLIGLDLALVYLMIVGLACWRRFGPKNGNVPIQVWIVIAWIVGLAVTTPLYHPYPRLILPWLIGAMIGAGLAVSIILHSLATGLSEAAAVSSSELARPRSNSTRNVVQMCQSRGFRTVIAGGVVVLLTIGTPAWQDRRSLARGAGEVVAAIQVDLPRRPGSEVPEYDCVIYVLGEPGLYYHLAAQAGERLRYVAQPASNLGMLEPQGTDPRVPTYLVTGPHAQAESRELSARQGRAAQVAIVDYQPSDLVLLDEVSPGQLDDNRRQSLQLWVVKHR